MLPVSHPPYVQPFNYFCTAQHYKASLFTGFVSCLSSIYNCCTMENHTGLILLHLHIFITFPWNTDYPIFKHLCFSSRSNATSLLTLIVQQTVTFLSSNVLANLSYKNFLDWCDNSCLRFYRKVITVSSNFFTSAQYISMLQIKSNTAHTPFSPTLHIVLLSLDFMS
jgi:hypothetical protein